METKITNVLVDSFNAAGVSWLHLLREKKNGEDNVLISPFSLSLALYMVAQGADKNTFKEMSTILSLPETSSSENNKYLSGLVKLLTSSDKAEFLCSNSIWTKDITLNKNFKGEMEKQFGAEIAPLESAEKVNEWVSKATKGKITSIGAIPSNIVMVLVNALYFKGLFESPFDTKLTKPGKFNTGKGTSIDISMMHRTGNIDYAVSQEFSSIKLVYSGRKPSFECLIFLPNDHKQSPSSLLDKIFVNHKLNVFYVNKKVVVTMPKFSVKYEENEFLETLKSQGFKTNLFTGIADESLLIDKIVHKTTLEMNEEGTVATAVTAVMMARSMAFHAPPEFVCDRPFLLLLMEAETQTVLFLGEINNPAPLS